MSNGELNSNMHVTADVAYSKFRDTNSTDGNSTVNGQDFVCKSSLRFRIIAMILAPTVCVLAFILFAINLGDKHSGLNPTIIGTWIVHDGKKLPLTIQLRFFETGQWALLYHDGSGERVTGNGTWNCVDAVLKLDEEHDGPKEAIYESITTWDIGRLTNQLTKPLQENNHCYKIISITRERLVVSDGQRESTWLRATGK